MAYLRPNAFERGVFNRLAMKFGISGPETLTIPGRRSGTSQRVPVIPVEHGGARLTTYWKKLPDPADHPFFRIDPA